MALGSWLPTISVDRWNYAFYMLCVFCILCSLSNVTYYSSVHNNMSNSLFWRKVIYKLLVKHIFLNLYPKYIVLWNFWLYVEGRPWITVLWSVYNRIELLLLSVIGNWQHFFRAKDSSSDKLSRVTQYTYLSQCYNIFKENITKAKGLLPSKSMWFHVEYFAQYMEPIQT